MGSLKWLDGALDQRSRVLNNSVFYLDNDYGLSTIQNLARVARRSVFVAWTR